MMYLYPTPKKAGYTYRQLKDLWFDGFVFTDSDNQEWTCNDDLPNQICLWCKVTNSKITNPTRKALAKGDSLIVKSSR